MVGDFSQTQREYRENDPTIEVDQRWIAVGTDRSIRRRIRILAPFPDGIDGERAWIYMEQPGGTFRTDNGRLGICPEFNLRYVFELES